MPGATRFQRAHRLSLSAEVETPMSWAGSIPVDLTRSPSGTVSPPMAGSTPDSTAPEKASEILGQMGVELAFVEPDGDAGLLPINSLVMDLEEFVLPVASSGVAAGISVARGWLDRDSGRPGPSVPSRSGSSMRGMAG